MCTEVLHLTCGIAMKTICCNGLRVVYVLEHDIYLLYFERCSLAYLLWAVQKAVKHKQHNSVSPNQMIFPLKGTVQPK